MSLTTIRTDLADALEGAGRVVYAFPKEQIVGPAFVLVPGSPYIEVTTGGGGAFTGMTVRFSVTAAVDVADNQAALTNLETLMIDALVALPSDMNARSWSSPQVLEVSGKQMLTSELQVECYANVA